MRLYHTTTADAATAILRDGFRDATGSYGMVGYMDKGEDFFLIGDWFANKPASTDEGAVGDSVVGDPVLVIEIDEAAITDFEVVEEGKPYREWCIPAQLANAHLLGVIYEPGDAGWDEGWWEAAVPSRPLDEPACVHQRPI